MCVIRPFLLMNLTDSSATLDKKPGFEYGKTRTPIVFLNFLGFTDCFLQYLLFLRQKNDGTPPGIHNDSINIMQLISQSSNNFIPNSIFAASGVFVS